MQRVDIGARLIDDAGTTIEEIVSSVKSVTDIMAEISLASQEQSTGIESVNHAVGEMDEATQQNAAMVEQASSAAASLQKEGQMLAEVVGVFQFTADPEGGRITNHVAIKTPGSVALTKVDGPIR